MLLKVYLVPILIDLLVLQVPKLVFHILSLLAKLFSSKLLFWLLPGILNYQPASQACSFKLSVPLLSISHLRLNLSSILYQVLELNLVIYIFSLPVKLFSKLSGQRLYIWHSQLTSFLLLVLSSEIFIHWSHFIHWSNFIHWSCFIHINFYLTFLGDCNYSWSVRFYLCITLPFNDSFLHSFLIGSSRKYISKRKLRI